MAGWLRASLLALEREWLLLRRDRVGLFMLLIAPVLVIGAAGFSLANIYGTAPAGATYKLALVDDDGAQVGAAVRDLLRRAPGIALVSAADPATARRMVVEQRAALLGLVIPRGSSAALRRGENIELMMISDPVRYLQTVRIEVELGELCRRLSATLTAQAQHELAAQAAQMRRDVAIAAPTLELPALAQTPRLPGNVGLRAAGGAGFNAFDLQVPGFAITFLLIGMLIGLGLALIDEQEWGTLTRIRTSASPLSAALLGKVGARFLIGFAQLAILFTVGWIMFGMSLGAHPAALLAPGAAMAFAGAGFGLIVASLGRTRDAVLPLGAIVIMIMAAMGGCWWPLEFEPQWMQQAALALPTTWAMRAFNDLMIRGLPATAALWPSMVNLGFGILYAAAGAFLARRRFA